MLHILKGKTGYKWESGSAQSSPFLPVSSLFFLSSSRQSEPPKKEKETITSSSSHSKRADEWKDPWRRSKSPKKKHGLSASPSHARRRRKTSASSASASGSSRCKNWKGWGEHREICLFGFAFFLSQREKTFPKQEN